jgi:hypothetical protein
LLGGSNVAFGFDSELIKKSLGRPVVNMGLHGGLGLRYSLNESQPYIRKGDIVIVAPEYAQFDDPNGTCDLLHLLYVYPRGLQYIAPENVWSFPRSFKELLFFKKDWWKGKGLTMPLPGGVYDRSVFNSSGDVTIHQFYKLPPSSRQFPATSSLLEAPQSEGPTIRMLDDFQKRCASKGATVYFAYPPVISDYYSEPVNRERAELLDKYLREQTHLIVLSPPGRDAFPRQDFFDTIDHLGWSARTARSRRLVDDLLAAGLPR